jgi:hypothetical protein
MNYKYFLSILSLIIPLFACDQKNDVKDEDSQYENEQMQGQGQMRPQDQMPDNQPQGGSSDLQQQPQGQAAEVSDKELKQFAKIAQKSQILGEVVQQNMVKAIEEENLTPQRFTELQNAQQDTEQKVKASVEEMENFNAAMQKLQKIQSEAQQKMLSEIKKNGMTEERYNEIASVLQSNSDLMKRFQDLNQPK